ncbi:MULTISPECIES: universal stress protein [unclassified Haladaptatus]|uniref:universal stress protein n=1 Tax=unclassified Haladaptatus TaxID=2622732 RepID=UPI0023E7CCC9|nr:MULTISPECIES: universal stress protein [unclassified Haladaptatus]
MIERILIAVGEERMHVEELTELAVEIATPFDAHVTLLRVYAAGEFKQLLDGFEYDSADPSDMAKRNAVVREAARVVKDAGLEQTVVGLVGNTADEVIDYVDTHDVDHVFIGGRKRSPAGKALLGSTSQDIILGLSVPCTVYNLG